MSGGNYRVNRVKGGRDVLFGERIGRFFFRGSLDFAFDSLGHVAFRIGGRCKALCKADESRLILNNMPVTAINYYL